MMPRAGWNRDGACPVPESRSCAVLYDEESLGLFTPFLTFAGGAKCAQTSAWHPGVLMAGYLDTRYSGTMLFFCFFFFFFCFFFFVWFFCFRDGGRTAR